MTTPSIDDQFRQKTIAFFADKPFKFERCGVLFTQWYPITEQRNVEKLQKIEGLHVNRTRMLVRKYSVLKHYQ